MAVTTSRSAKVTLPADDQILITREFDAPSELVYKAFTTPELVRRWWHAKRGEMTVADIDLRVGGTYRFVMDAGRLRGRLPRRVPRDRPGREDRLVRGLRRLAGRRVGGDGSTVNTVTFAEEDGRTTLTLLIQAANKTSRDAIIESGMEDGLQDALDLLEETAQSIR